MAINKNHEFEELDGIKCGIVEKNVLPGRVEFLKKLLNYNGYTVVVVPTPPPKAVPAKPAPKPVVVNVDAAPIAEAPAPAAAVVEAIPEPAPVAPSLPETFTVGVTDYTFNSINAVFGRLLRTPDNHVVTLAYWNQEEAQSNDEVPYYEATDQSDH